MKCVVGGYFGERTKPRGDTQYVRNLLENPPDGVEYVIPNEKLELHNSKYYQFLKKYKTVDVEVRYHRRIEEIARLIKWRTTELREIRVLEENVDLIFYNHGFFLSNQPYVSAVDGDYVLTNHPGHSPLRRFDMNNLPARLYQRTILKHILLKKNLKKILFWSNRALSESLKVFPEIKDKSCVLYPPIKVPELTARKEGDKIRLFFVGGNWIWKGLPILTSIFTRLKARYDVELSVVTRKSFQLTEPDPNIKVLYDATYERVYPECYLESDVFVLPSRFEVFGYSILEAMACGLPVVTSRTYATPEIVDDGKTGYLTPYGDMRILEEKLVELIEDASLRKRMGRAGRRKAEEKFSLKEFKDKLGGIYEECLRC